MRKIETSEVAQIKHNILWHGVYHAHGDIWLAQVKQFCEENKGKCARLKISLELIE